MMLIGLSDPIHTSQHIFRAILNAMSEPATVVEINETDAWERLNAASVGVLLTLCDQHTNVFFSESLVSDTLIHSTQFHTQALISNAKSAQFAFTCNDEFNSQAYDYGNEIYPEQSTTVVVQVDDLTNGSALRLSGAGIQQTKTISPSISEALLTHYQEQTKLYPLGIDTILTCGNQLIAIPRTTLVEAVCT